MSNDDKKDTFIEIRLMAKGMPERVLLDMLTDSVKTYQNDKTEENRRQAHMVMMMITMKWGDAEHNRNEEDIIKNTEKLNEISTIHENMSSVNDIINDTDDGS